MEKYIIEYFEDFDDIENERLKTGAELLKEAFSDNITAQDILSEWIQVGFIQNPCN